MWILEFSDGELLSQVENKDSINKIDPNNPPKQVRAIYYDDAEHPIMYSQVPVGCKPVYEAERFCEINGKIINSIIKIGFRDDKNRFLIAYNIKNNIIFNVVGPA